MAACVAGSLAAELGPGIGGNVEEAKLQQHDTFAEDILQAYVMAAVEIAAGGNHRCPQPAASILHDPGEVQPNAASSFLSKFPDADLPGEEEIVDVETMTKILHDELESVALLSPAHYTGGIQDGSELADFDVPKVTKGVIEENFVKETATEHKKTSIENCLNYLKVSAASPSNGTAKVSHDTGEASMSADVMVVASEELGGAKDGADVRAPSHELAVMQTLGRANEIDAEDEELSETGKGPASNLTREAIGVLEDSDATEVDEILVDERDVQIRPSVINSSESEAKVEVSSTGTTNIKPVGNVDHSTTISRSFSFTGLNHVAFCVENLERSLEFYCGLLGLKTNIDRPELPYRGAWLFLGAEGIHIMEVPNPDPVIGRPPHGGYDRHACLNCKNVEGVRVTLEKAGIPYQPSPVPSLFTRDPDGNGLEFIEVDS